MLTESRMHKGTGNAESYGGGDSALAIDGKTIRGAIDADGNQTHVLGIVGHGSKAFWGQKKSA